MRLASFAARALRGLLGRLPAGLMQHARSRATPLAIVGLAAAAISMVAPPIGEATPSGVSDALGVAAGAAVDPADFVWAPSRGAFLDAFWGRDVTFLGRAPSVAGPAPRDVYRARLSVAPNGRPLRVETWRRETDTAAADEHDLLGRGDELAWAVRGKGGEHGATVSLPRAPAGFAAMAIAAARDGSLPWRGGFDVVLAEPADSLAIELREEGLVLAIRNGDQDGRALIDSSSLELRRSGDATDLRVVPHEAGHPRAELWQKDTEVTARPETAIVDAPVDAGLFPAAFAWRAVAAPRITVTSEQAAPAPVVVAVVEQGGGRVVLTGFDPRQLVLRVVPGPAAPHAEAGLPGSGALAHRDAEHLVATAELWPVQHAEPGAIEQGRTLSSLSLDAPRVAADERGNLSLRGAVAFPPFGAVQTGAPRDGERVAAWCQSAGGAIVVATAWPPSRALIEQALAPLACTAISWLADGAGEAEPRIGPERFVGRAPFAAFLRAQAFPDGRKEPWKASAGRQPRPAFRPAVLEHEELVLGERVRVTAFVAERFSWALRVGSRERSHRAGGSFPAVIEESLLARAIAAIDVGVGHRKRPNGLTIGGSTGHAYASRGAVLLASNRGLALLASAEVREDPPEDGVELPLTASAGSPTPAALERGLLQERGDICVLPDGTALVALARFESHAATVEALCRMGCTEVAALDRGLDVAPSLSRVGSAPLSPTYAATRLIALERGSVMTR